MNIIKLLKQRVRNFAIFYHLVQSQKKNTVCLIIKQQERHSVTHYLEGLKPENA